MLLYGMFHAYLEGYSVLPKLKKLTGNIFQSHDLEKFLAEKQTAMETQKCQLEYNMSPEIYEAAISFIREHCPHQLVGPYTFGNLAMQVCEDLIIHRLDETTDWLAATHVCFPSGWRPEENIGKPLIEIHKPVVGMNLKTSRKLIETMVFHGPFERYVWSVLFEPRINGHPSRPKKPFSPENPQIWVRVERQITWGLPELSAALFVLRQHLIPEDELDKPALIKALEEMSPEHLAYKGYTSCVEDVIKHLRLPSCR